jgi:hypothetical protein
MRDLTTVILCKVERVDDTELDVTDVERGCGACNE